MIVPYKRFTIETPITIDQAVQALSQVVQSPQFLPTPLSVKRKQFIGSVSEDGFKFIRNVYYLNSFLPDIIGTFQSSEGLTKLRITMAGNPCVLIALTAVCAFFGFFLMTYLMMEILSDLMMIVGSLASGGLGYLIYTSAFNAAVTVDERYLVAFFSQFRERD